MPAGHIRNYRNALGVRELVEACAVDGVVVADVEIVGLGVELGFIQLGDVGEGLIL